MDLTVAAIDRLAALGIRPDERLVEMDDGRVFGVDQDGKVSEIRERAITAQEALEINTLSGFVNYVKANLDRTDDKLLVHIKYENNEHIKP